MHGANMKFHTMSHPDHKNLRDRPHNEHRFLSWFLWTHLYLCQRHSTFCVKKKLNLKTSYS